VSGTSGTSGTKKHPGRFIVIEGIDGAGTTTQTALLVAKLRTEGRLTRGTREPSDGPVGTLIRQVLGGRFVLPGGRAPGWATMALLFAADRLDHVEAEIEPLLEKGGVVISDRYDASSLAYQSVTSGRGGPEAVEWIRTLNHHAVRPDVIVVVDVPADMAAVRREARGEAAQLYEQNEMQQQLAAFYRDLALHMPKDRVVVVDGTGTAEEVHVRVVGAILSTCGLPEI
jgi:dTMP kinase